MQLHTRILAGLGLLVGLCVVAVLAPVRADETNGVRAASRQIGPRQIFWDGNARRIQGVTVKNPLGCANLSVLAFVTANSDIECLALSGVGSITGTVTTANVMVCVSSAGVIKECAGGPNTLAGNTTLTGNFIGQSAAGAVIRILPAAADANGIVMDSVNHAQNTYEPWAIDGSLVKFNTNNTGGRTLFNSATDDGVTDVQLNGVGGIKSPLYKTLTNCLSAASPSVCAAAPAGSVAVAAGSGTLVVNTTAVTANSQIFIQSDSSLGTRLSVTCNVTASVLVPSVTARTAGTSFTITVTAPAVNPGCYSYEIVN